MSISYYKSVAPACQYSEVEYSTLYKKVTYLGYAKGQMLHYFEVWKYILRKDKFEETDAKVELVMKRDFCKGHLLEDFIAKKEQPALFLDAIARGVEHNLREEKDD